MRGIVPKAWWPELPFPEEGIVREGGSAPWGPGFYFTDASGGDSGQDQRLRRCGWGAARLNVLAVPYPE
eukprot:80398-Lingulodinium_polyedra.AAC.1